MRKILFYKAVWILNYSYSKIVDNLFFWKFDLFMGWLYYVLLTLFHYEKLYSLKN